MTRVTTPPGKAGARRIRYAVAMSLDGFIAGPHGEADWILMDPAIDFGAFVRQFDTVLIGRRTFEAAQHGGGGGMPGMKAIVFSRTLRQAAHPKIAIVSDDAAGQMRALKHQPGKDIWLMGGGGLFSSLVEAGVVDTVEVAVIPVLLGAGIPLLPPEAGNVKLTLVSSRVYDATGTVSLEYLVNR